MPLKSHCEKMRVFIFNDTCIIVNSIFDLKLKRFKCDLVEVIKTNKVTYYSFHLNGDSHSELEKFVTAFNKPGYETDYKNIMDTITRMGDVSGAEAHNFRHELKAEALPPPYMSGNLRLFCCRVTRDVVLLGNGCLKITQKVQHSKECLSHFKVINALSEQITRRMVARDLMIVDKKFDGDLVFGIG